jgi:hypothetical protein
MKYIEQETRLAVNATPLAYFHTNWTRHGAPLLDMLGAVVDHVDAFSAGGSDAIDKTLARTQPL